MKRKAMDMLAGAALTGIACGCCYIALKNKKNMIDVIIEEIETMK